MVLGNTALEALAAMSAPTLVGLGPRARAKYGDELLGIVAAHPPGRYLLPMDQRDSEILERIDSGERMFRSGAVGEPARRAFEALVEHLRDLRERGLIDMPERSVTSGEEAGAHLMAGPCVLTEAGRAALREFRQANRRLQDRRAGERRGQHRPALPMADAERRKGSERRQGDRRS
jgi:hypothetical protein